MREAIEAWFTLPVPRFVLLGLVAVLLGLLIGIERERHRVEEKGDFWAGIRTFALFTLLGFLGAEMGRALGPAILLVAFGGFAALIVTAYAITGQRGGTGITTEAAALVAFFVGVLVSRGLVLEAAGTSVVTAALLSLKMPLHRFARSVSERDVSAALKFCTLSVILLPILPDRSFGPHGAFNPFRIGLLVVILLGISFAGYVLAKTVGGERGIMLTGFLGGLVSSTAVTVSMSRRSREEGAQASLLAGASLLACIVMLPRMYLLAFALSPDLGAPLAGPLAGMAVAGLLSWFVLRRKQEGGRDGGRVELGNPFDLGEALRFAAIFFTVLFLVRLAREEMGAGGMLGVAALSGLTDVDAITVSVATEVGRGFALTLGMLSIAIAAIVNTLFKGGIGWWYGSAAFRHAWVPACSAMMLGGVAGAWLSWALLAG